MATPPPADTGRPDNPIQESDWPEVGRIMAELWPGHGSKLTKEQVNVWQTALKRFPKAWIVAALRHHAIHSKFFPKPVEIFKVCKREEERQRNERLYQGNQDVLAAETQRRAEIQQERADHQAILDDFTDQELEAHKQTLLAQDWRLHWAEPLPPRKMPWAAHLVKRIKAKLGPETPDPDLDPPPRPKASGDLSASDLLKLL